MFDWFLDLPHTVQALLATLFTWGVTALGAGFVFFFRTMNKNALDAMLGFAAGVMTAASLAAVRCSFWATGCGSAWSSRAAGRAARAGEGRSC